MSDLQRDNLRAIDHLNQRGGRMLSLVDLLKAGTVDLPLAAELALTAANGGSFLTAAGPGGVGKTTLMAAMLGFGPPATRIVTIETPADLARPPSGPECLLVHEIGSGSWFGYLWGPAVAEYIGLIGPDRCIASNLHADTWPEARSQLTGPPLNVPAEDLARVDLLVFMASDGSRRRVTEVWRQTAAGRELTWRWRREDDRFERVAGDAPPAAGRTADFLARAAADGCERLEDLRRRALAERLT